MMRDELGETIDHAMRAAGHAAGGIRASMGPRMGPAAERFRDVATDGWGSTKAALAARAESARTEPRRDGKQAQRQLRRHAKQAERRIRRLERRWPRMFGLLAGGIAVGAIAAYVMRQRRQQEWQEYDPTEALEAGEPPEAGLTTPPAPAGRPGAVGSSVDTAEERRF